MKAVLISIQPKWCELIVSGKKIVEVRKTKPKLETPFKVYVYETQGYTRYCNKCRDEGCSAYAPGAACFEGKGKVIGEFVCDSFDEFTPSSKGVRFHRFRALGDTCLSLQEIMKYLNGHIGYGWHISDLVIYENPKELSEFKKECKYKCDMRSLKEPPCEKCDNSKITKPPQSWCYVEELT